MHRAPFAAIDAGMSDRDESGIDRDVPFFERLRIALQAFLSWSDAAQSRHQADSAVAQRNQVFNGSSGPRLILNHYRIDAQIEERAVDADQGQFVEADSEKERLQKDQKRSRKSSENISLKGEVSSSGEEEEEERAVSDEEGEQEEKASSSQYTRKRHPLSEGESESEDPNVLWRSLRPEEDPQKLGLRPPKGHDPAITASAHIAAGSKAKTKSAWVSASRSRKVAGAWATAAKGGKRVAKFRLPSGARERKLRLGDAKTQSRAVYDLTEREQALEVFPTGRGSSYHSALASQEVIIHGGVEKEAVEGVFDAVTVTVKKYEELKALKAQGKTPMHNGQEVHALFRTRAKKTGKPLPRLLLKRV